MIWNWIEGLIVRSIGWIVRVCLMHAELYRVKRQTEQLQARALLAEKLLAPASPTKPPEAPKPEPHTVAYDAEIRYELLDASTAAKN